MARQICPVLKNAPRHDKANLIMEVTEFMSQSKGIVYPSMFSCRLKMRTLETIYKMWAVFKRIKNILR